MNLKDIPIVPIGPGSQPAESDGSDLAFIDLPKDITTYRRPEVPEAADVTHLDGAREAMRWLRRALAEPAAAELKLADLSALDSENRELVNQVLGEGEVSVTRSGEINARSQESVLAGVWRTLYVDSKNRVARDLLEVGPAPHIARIRPTGGRAFDIDTRDVPDGLMNALPILTELESHCERFARDRQPRSINLSLLPLSDEDIEFLDQRLGRGPVDILSRSYGKCQVISTALNNVWWVRYYNSMSTPILNTLEVTALPQVVCAAAEDLHDSAQRLEEILAPYWADVA